MIRTLLKEWTDVAEIVRVVILVSLPPSSTPFECGVIDRALEGYQCKNVRQCLGWGHCCWVCWERSLSYAPLALLPKITGFEERRPLA
jgi:hypothetical protein